MVNQKNEFLVGCVQQRSVAFMTLGYKVWLERRLPVKSTPEQPATRGFRSKSQGMDVGGMELRVQLPLGRAAGPRRELAGLLPVRKAGFPDGPLRESNCAAGGHAAPLTSGEGGRRGDDFPVTPEFGSTDPGDEATGPLNPKEPFSWRVSPDPPARAEPQRAHRQKLGASGAGSRWAGGSASVEADAASTSGIGIGFLSDESDAVFWLPSGYLQHRGQVATEEPICRLRLRFHRRSTAAVVVLLPFCHHASPKKTNTISNFAYRIKSKDDLR